MVLQTDARIKGLDAYLIQQGKPVYFTSKTLTETQKGYVAIKLKSLVVAWAIDKFHHFLYGTHIILETDQKPLEASHVQEFKPSYTMIAKNSYQNIPVSFYSTSHSRTNESIG